MTDHAAAVEAVRARHEEDDKLWALDSRSRPANWRQAHADRATLLRAYEAVVAFIAASGTVVQAGVDFVKNHADQLATLRAQHAALVAECEGLRGELTDFLMRTAKARELQAMLDEQRATLDAARAYIQHLAGCWRAVNIHNGCSCGRDALLATLGGAEGA